MVQTPGLYSLKIGDNTHLRLGTGARLIRRFSGYDDVNAVIRNRDNVNGNTNIRLSGGTIEVLDAANFGRLVGFIKAKSLRVEGMRLIHNRGDWNCSFNECDDVSVTGMYIQSQDNVDTNEDGLHFYGCQRVTVSDCVIRTADDALSFTQSPVRAMEYVVVSNMVLQSYKAHALRISASAGSIHAMRCIQVSNVVAKTGRIGALAGRGLLIENLAGDGVIQDVDIDGFQFDGATSNAQCALIVGAWRLRLHRFVALLPATYMEISDCDDIELVDCVIDIPRGSSVSCVLVSGTAPVNNLRIRGGLYRFASHHTIYLGAPTVGFQISDARLQGNTSSATPTLAGIWLENATLGIVANNQISGCALSGIYEDTPSNNNLFIGNTIRDVTGANNLVVTGANSQAIRNVTDLAEVIADTGGFRQTIGGWTVPNIDEDFGPAEMDRVGGRFRAPRPGSLMGLVLGVTNARAAGTMTAKVYKNTGAAGSVASPVDTLLSVTINTTGANRAFATRAMDFDGASKFLAGDELYVVLEVADWDPDDTIAYCAIEIET